MEFTLLQQAHIMSCARKHHKRGKSVLNWRLAIDMGLADAEKDAKLVCHGIGLAGGCGKTTSLKSMKLHIERNKHK